MDNRKQIKKNLFRKSSEIRGTPVKGYDFNNGTNFEHILDSFGKTGFQATGFAKATSIVSEMISKQAFIFLGYTSNMVSSGLRDVIRYLVEHEKVHALVTTAGGIEEDIIKCLGDFYIGDFEAVGAKLRKKGINRIGNIYAPNNRYVAFEKFVQPILREMHLEFEKTGIIPSATQLIYALGKKINNENSICYWAYKNKIPIYCPAITDGAIGDNIYFYHLSNPSFVMDFVRDVSAFNNLTIGLKRSGAIILGAGIVKHVILNANMLRNGADYSVYINTSQEFDGSDAGARPDEAVSWGKLSPKAKTVKVFGDATVLFPLLVAKTFAKHAS